MMRYRSVLVGCLIGVLILVLYCGRFSRQTSDGEVSTPEEAAAPEQLHSAAWVSGDVESAAVVDTEQPETCLRNGKPYLLKLALQELPFELGIGEGAAVGELSPIEPGAPLGITYLSDQLEPSFGSRILEAPARQETGLVSFPVRARGQDGGEVRVSLLISAGGVTFGRTSLDLTMASESGMCGVGPGVQVGIAQQDSYRIDPGARANYLDASWGPSVNFYISPRDANAPFGLRINSDGPLRLYTPGNLGATPNSLHVSLRGLRDRLNAIRDQYRSSLDDESIDPGVREDLLRQLAEEGYRLYNDLFPKRPELQSLRSALDRIRDYSLQHGPLRIRIIHGGGEAFPDQPARLLVPFGLLYDAPGFSLDQSKSAPVDPKGFWGARYLIEYEVDGMMAKTGSLCRSDGIRLAAALDRKCTGQGDWCRLIQGQVDELGQLYRQPEWIDDEDSLSKILKGDGDAEHDLLYYYGHTLGGPRPSLHLQETKGGGLELGLLEDQLGDGTFLRGNPVVFLNSCSSAGFPGESYDTFLDMMARLQASAFIGTETAVRPAYASKVGRHLLRELASRPEPDSLGRVFWKIRRDTLESDTGNPLILIYSLLGDSLVRVCS